MDHGRKMTGFAIGSVGVGIYTRERVVEINFKNAANNMFFVQFQ